MKMTADEVQRQLKALGRGPKHSLGQNFLIDKDVAATLADALTDDLGAARQQILEIGPGLGALTAALLARLPAGGRLVAVERDHGLAARLSGLLGNPRPLLVVPVDIVKFRRAELFTDGQFVLAANLPFLLTNFVLHDFLTKRPRPAAVIVMLQREVADRVLAEAGDSARGTMSVIAEHYCRRQRLIDVPKTAFFPEPKVAAAIIKLTLRQEIKKDDERFFRFVKSLFTSRRKMLRRSLPTATSLSKEAVLELLSRLKIDSSSRPQELTLAEWRALFAAVQD